MKTTKLIAVAVTTALLASGAAFAKGHDQGSTTVPGEDVGTGTVAASQTLGSAKGNRPDDKGPSCPGNSCSAGK